MHQQRPDVDLLRKLGALTLAADEPDAVPNSLDDASSDAEDMWTNLYSSRDPDESSSIFPLIRTVADLSAEFTSSAATESEPRTRFARRPEFWQPPYYEARMNNKSPHKSINQKPLILPPEETMKPLVARFFDEHNFFYPLFQRRLFEQQLALETKSEHFNAILLLVCASGAQLGMNPEAERCGQPPGWAYFEQVIPLLNIPVFATAKLEEVQMLIVRTHFAIRLSLLTQVAVGVRLLVNENPLLNALDHLSRSPSYGCSSWRSSSQVLSKRAKPR